MEHAGPTPALGDNRSKPLALLLERSSQANPTGARNGKRHSVFQFSFYWGYHRCSLGLDKEGDELRRFRRASVPGNDVNVIRIFIESVTGLQGEFRSAFHLHDD